MNLNKNVAFLNGNDVCLNRDVAFLNTNVALRHDNFVFRKMILRLSAD